MFGDRAIIAYARFMARDEVRATIRRQGLKVHHFSARKITEEAEKYIRKHPEIIKDLQL
jgi:hypothetical protein